jgi:hypothetical protein
VHGKHRVEPSGHSYPERFGGELELGGVGGEVEGGGLLGQPEPLLVVAVEDALVELALAGEARLGPVGEPQRVPADPRVSDHGHRDLTGDPGDPCPGRQFFKLHRVLWRRSTRRNETTLEAGADKADGEHYMTRRVMDSLRFISGVCG